MVAELTLFLSQDRKVQVRAHVTKRGKEIFCVKDFIRQTANKSIGPNDAVVYWLSSLAQLMHEDDVMEQYMVQFPGPYEKANVCLKAEGLLILYGHMCTHFDWVNKEYEVEVRDTLYDIVERKSASAYVEMFDDGEVDALLTERGDMELECPPEGSAFHYVDPEADAKFKVFQEEKERMVKELTARLEAKSVALEEANAKLCEMEASQEFKRRKQNGFTVGEVLKAKGLAIEDKEVFCKRLISKFKAVHPELAMFKRRDVACFYAEDRSVVEDMVGAEYELMLLEEGRLDE